MTDAIRKAFPTLCSLLAENGIDRDIAIASSLAGEGEEESREVSEGEVFELKEVMRLLAGAMIPEFIDSTAHDLEANLSTVIEAVGMQSARSAYLEKLSANDRGKLEDTCYEIAAAAKACRVLDRGTIVLEKPIPDTKKEQRNWKNSDVFGSFHGCPVRIEVTVLHEDPPPAIHEDLDALVKATEISSGFDLTLRGPLVDVEHAERVRVLIELLHERHLVTGGATEEIDNVRFRWAKGAYVCDQPDAPIAVIAFYADKLPRVAPLRRITHPCSVRSMTPNHIIDDNPSPPGFVSFADVSDSPIKVPVSTKIRQSLERKLEQCEDGIINIVAFGIPLPMHDRDFDDAMRGVAVVAVRRTSDANGVPSLDSPQLLRDRKSPFVPDSVLSNDERIQFVDAFRKMSAAWLLRLGPYFRSELLLNPNAAVPVPGDLRDLLTGSASSSEAQSTSPASGDPTTDVHAHGSTRADDFSDEVFSTVIAQDFVCICGNHAKAREALAALKLAAPCLEDIRAQLDQLASPDRGGPRTMQFISPTNEEAALQFVVDCGGYPQAEACLNADEDECLRQASAPTVPGASPSSSPHGEGAK